MGERRWQRGLPEGQVVVGVLLVCLALLTWSASVDDPSAQGHREVALAGRPASARLTVQPVVRLVPVVVRPRVVQGRLPAAEVCTPYARQLTATDAVGPYRWSVVRGRTPDGLRLGPGGRLHGTPTIATTARFVVRVAAGNGHTSRRVLVVATRAGARPCLAPRH
jgi:hypothetical protein